jgi:DNA-binding IclR family transcriptional regulator
VAGNGSEPRRTVVSKVVAIIRSIASGGALTVTEIAQVADLPLSTTHRLVHEMAAWGVLHRGEDGRYETGLPHHTHECDGPADVRALAAPVVEDLSAVTLSDVRLGVLDGVRVAYVEKPHGSWPLTVFSDAATLPVHATALGKALLAFCPQDAVDHVLRHGLRSYTDATVVTAAGLRHTLKETRLRGMAVACGELLPEHRAVAVPVFAAGGEVAAALEVRVRHLPAELPVVVPALTVAARALARELGRVAPPSRSPAHAAERRPRTAAPVALLERRRVRDRPPGAADGGAADGGAAHSGRRPR